LSNRINMWKKIYNTMLDFKLKEAYIDVDQGIVYKYYISGTIHYTFNQIKTKMKDERLGKTK